MVRQMKLLLALITITLSVAGQDTSATSDERDIGTWRVSKLVFHNESALTNGLTRAQARAELGPTLVITKAGLKKLEKSPALRAVSLRRWTSQTFSEPISSPRPRALYSISDSHRALPSSTTADVSNCGSAQTAT